MKKKLIVLSGFVLGLAPVLALAQQVGGRGCQIDPSGNTTTLMSMLCRVNELLGIVVPILIALGVVYFIWGVITYVIASDEEAKKKGRNSIIFGIIGLAVIIAMWGLVGVLNRTFGVSGASSVTTPVVPGFNN